jgi:hypothetical protein
VVARLGRHSEAVRRLAEAVAVLGDASLSLAADLAAVGHERWRPPRARPAAGELLEAEAWRPRGAHPSEQGLVEHGTHDELLAREGLYHHLHASQIV